MNDARQPQTGFVETNETYLYYEMLGEGHPLVLLHGGYMDRRMWDAQFEAFARYYQVIRYDIRGFGKSAFPPLPYANQQDLHMLLTFLGIEKTHLVGLSMGGEIALDFTLEYPDMVDALVLVGASVSGVPLMQLYTKEEIDQQVQRWQPFEQAMKERNIPAMVEALMNDPTLVPSLEYGAARQQVRQNLSEYSFVWVLQPASKLEIAPVAWDRLSEIRCPTLILVGSDDDVLLHRIADKLEQDIADVRRRTISQTHHMPNMEKPEVFNQIVLDFLRE
jgi:pimeloyl-ACP methyl ester carboxylesterase